MNKSLLSLSALLGFPCVVSAHSVHETASFMNGFLHPLTGIDHLLVILAIGFLAARSTSRVRWQLPVSFAAFMLIGLLMGTILYRPPFIELAIAVSVLAMGLVILLNTQINRLWQFILTTVFALLHGFVHGQELILSDKGSFAIFGMLVTTGLLLTVGLYLGSYKNRIGAYLQQAMVSVLTLGGTYFLLT